MTQKTKIMVIDDEKVILMGVKKELEAEGYEVTGFSNGKEAAAATKTEKFAIAFVDLWMPEMDGVETCKLIKANSPKTAVLLISGRPDGFGGREGDFIKEGGLDFFLYKPFMEGELLQITRKVLKEEA